MTGEQAKAEIRSVVYRMAERYGAMDTDGVLATFVDEGDILVVGTGADEVRFGREELRRQIDRDLSEVETLSVGMEHLSVSVFGETAFTFADAVMSVGMGEETLRFPMRWTLGLVQSEDGWRIAQSHASVPWVDQAPGRSFPVELTKTLSDLLASIDSDTDMSSLTATRLGTATILFTDIVNSTTLSQSMGDRVWSELITTHFDRVKEITERENGTVVKTLGDGGMYVFTSGASALSTAVRTQQAVTGAAHDLQLRVGIHTGDVVQGRDDYIGVTVNKAARVAAAAEGGQILVSSTTADVVSGSGLDFGDPVNVELKGIEGTHILYPLNWA